MHPTQSAIASHETLQTLFDDKARKQWLIFSLLILMVYPLFEGIVVLAYYSDLGKSWEQAFWDFFRSVFGSQISFWLIYFLAYKGGGTKFLTFNIFVSGLGVLSLISSLFVLIFTATAFLNYNALILSALISASALFQIVWIFVSCKLMRDNRVRYLLKKYPDQTLYCLHFMNQSNNSEELNSNLYQLVQKKPLLEPLISAAYRVRKNALQRI